MAWWVHRFPVLTTALYKVTRAAPMIPGEDMRSPDNDTGYLSIPIAEAALSNMGVIGDTSADWYIHRKKGHNAFDKWYQIDHDPSNANWSKTCPAAPPGYPSIKELADATMLNTMHSTNACGVMAMFAAQYRRRAKASAAKKSKRGKKK